MTIPRKAAAKAAKWLATLAGLALLVGLVVHEGAGDVGRALARAGWPLLWLVPLHALPLLLDAQGWRVLLAPVDRQRRALLPFVFWVATVREAVSRLLPSLSIGGEVVGVRLAAVRVPDTSAVAATVIVELLLTMVGQYVFCGLGVALLAGLAPAAGPGRTIILGLLLSLPVPVACAYLLRHGAPFARLGALARRMFGQASRVVARLDGARLDGEIRTLLGRRRRLSAALAWQLAGYLLGSSETWLALSLLGHPVSVATAIGIEALLQVTRHLMFMVPAGLGTQEASIVLFARMAGIDGDVALALALVRRGREVLFGVPALASWQWFESRRLRRRAAPAPAGERLR